MTVLNYPTTDFSCSTPGENSSASSSAGMPPLHIASINGQTDLSSIMKGNDGACCYGITLMGSPGIYDYVIQVDAKGPSGVFSGGWHLSFTDVSDDTYTLYVYSSSRSTHTVRFNSKLPSIKKIEWHN